MVNRYQKPPLRVEDMKKKDEEKVRLLDEGEDFDLSGEEGWEPVEEGNNA